MAESIHADPQEEAARRHTAGLSGLKERAEDRAAFGRAESPSRGLSLLSSPHLRAPSNATARAGAMQNAQRTHGNRAVQRFLQRTGAGGPGGEEDDEIARRIEQKSGLGTSIDDATKGRLEEGLGADLSGVRVHTDEEADKLARSVSSVAFTSGQDIFFRRGAYNPSSPEGLQMLAHEATHTVQQAAGPVEGTDSAGGVSISDPSDRFERAAEKTAQRIVAGPSGGQPGKRPEEESLTAPGGLSVQRLASSGPYTQRAIQRWPEWLRRAGHWLNSPEPSLTSQQRQNQVGRAGGGHGTASGTQGAGGAAAEQHLASARQGEREALSDLMHNIHSGPGGASSEAMDHLENTMRQVNRGESVNRGLGRAGAALNALNYPMQVAGNLAQGQSRGEATAGGLGGAFMGNAAGGALMSRSPGVGVTDIAVNLVNAGAQAAGAPRAVTDVTGLAASAMPSSMIGASASNLARGVWNTGAAVAGGGHAGLHRQASDIEHGAAGAPLQGYGLIGEVIEAAVNPMPGQDMGDALTHLSTPAAASGSHGPVVQVGNMAGDALWDARQHSRDPLLRAMLGGDPRAAAMRGDLERVVTPTTPQPSQSTPVAASGVSDTLARAGNALGDVAHNVRQQAERAAGHVASALGGTADEEHVNPQTGLTQGEQADALRRLERQGAQNLRRRFPGLANMRAPQPPGHEIQLPRPGVSPVWEPPRTADVDDDTSAFVRPAP